MTCHPIQRAYQRYGLSLTTHDLRDLAVAIQNNEGTLNGRGSDGKSSWLIEVKGILCNVVMDGTLYIVLTFLPLNGQIGGKPLAPKQAQAKRPFYMRGRRVYRDKGMSV